MVTLARESLYEVFEDIQPLLGAHYDALSDKHSPLDPDWTRYAFLEASGPNVLPIFTARDDGRLVGYACFFCQPHIHYRTLFPAINDLVWIDPKARGALGVRLIRHCERELAPFADKVVWRAKPGTVLEKLLPRMGYALAESAWAKTLNNESAAARKE